MPSSELLRGAYAGRSAIVMGSGPSLRFVTEAMVKKHVSFAVNDAIGKFPGADFYSTCDPQMLNHRHWDVVRKSSCRIAVGVGIFANDWLSTLGQKQGDGIDPTRVYPFAMRDPANRTWDIRRADKAIVVGSSAQSAVNIAVILGCNPIYLVGCDCSFLEGRRYYWQFAGETFVGGVITIPEKKVLEEREPESDSELSVYVVKAWQFMNASSDASLIDASGGLLSGFMKSVPISSL